MGRSSHSPWLELLEEVRTMPRNLISPTELREALASDSSNNVPTLLDVRWRLDKPEGRDDYAAGHIPGAHYVSLDQELSDPSQLGLGRHPLPTPETVAELLARVGVVHGEPIVVYDDWNLSASARAWWVLTASGVKNVRILDGGYSGWVAAGGGIEVEADAPVGAAAGDVDKPRLADLYVAALSPVLNAEQAANVARAGLLLDARHPDRYAGRANPTGEVPGHIPGAASLAGTSLLDDDGFMKSPEALRDIFDQAGATADSAAAGEVGAYCGSGITACVVIAAAYSIDRDIALFPGSWSQWSADPDNPVER